MITTERYTEYDGFTYESFTLDSISLLDRIYRMNAPGSRSFAPVNIYAPATAESIAFWRQRGSRGDYMRRIRDDIGAQ